MSFFTKVYFEVRCDLALDKDNCRAAIVGQTQEDAEREALETCWVKRGWKHYCPECVRRQAIDAQKKPL